MSTKIAPRKIPNRMFVFPNKDKAFHESWTETRNRINIPHPFRAVLMGPPNSGKTMMVKNMLFRQQPPFEEVFVIHCDPDYTNEYADIHAKLMDEIPSPQSWEGKKKTMVILDDLEFKGMNKTQKRNLDRLFGFVSTHKNISVCLCSQDTFNVPPIVRRCSNLWVLWRMQDLDSLALCARKCGYSALDFRQLFKLLESPKDSIWIDLTDHSPYPLRRNGYEIIEHYVPEGADEEIKLDEEAQKKGKDVEIENIKKGMKRVDAVHVHEGFHMRAEKKPRH